MSNTFVVSARKYRPRRFADVVGQSHVTQTLQNAIISRQIASAFLFSGLKGSGKTSSSRIFARAINCDTPTGTGEPCDTCLSCSEQASFNIHELDAASHNSAEEMRKIVDQIRYCAPNGKKTIIIIDEAHMLSNAALNVLLKPLEDTPPHVVFMLVTTEKQKILPTIQSRCFKLNFRVVRVHEIQQHLAYVAGEEKIVADANALLLISQKAAGSLRDALSMFDLIVTFSGDNTLTYEAALRHLNLLDEKVYLEITDALYAGRMGDALLQYDTIIRQGFDGFQFVSDLGKHLRNLLVAKNLKTTSLLEVNPAVAALYTAKAAEISTSFIFAALSLAQNCQLHYKASPHQRLHVEMLLIDIGQLQSKAAIPQPKMVTVERPQAPAPTLKAAGEATHVQVADNPKKKEGVVYPSLKAVGEKKLLVAEPAPTLRTTLPKKNASSTIRIPSISEVQARAAANRVSEGEKTPATAVPALPLNTRNVTKICHTYADNMKKQRTFFPSEALQHPIGLTGKKITLACYKPLPDSFQKAITAHLQAKFQDPEIVVEGQVREAPNVAPKSYTDLEKFSNLCGEDPNVAYLKKTLSLVAR